MPDSTDRVQCKITSMPLMTTDQLALYLNIPKKTVRGWRDRKVGPPYIRVNGRLVRYRVRAVDAWLDSQTVTPP